VAVACACACAVGLSLALSRLLSGMLFGVSASDPPILSTVVASMLTVATVAAVVPCRRMFIRGNIIRNPRVEHRRGHIRCSGARDIRKPAACLIEHGAHSRRGSIGAGHCQVSIY
jgi:hypothetical protein